MAYTEQITFLLFLKMAHELTQPPHNRKPIVPAPFDWPKLLKREGDKLEVHYRHTLEELGKKPGMLGQLYRLIRNLIEPETWTSLEADVKGDVYERLLAKSAEESPKGAGQYFTPRALIKGIVDCDRPTADDAVCDPACGKSGFLLAAREYVYGHEGKDLDPDQRKHLRRTFAAGWELVPNTARLTGRRFRPN
jgi:type I restriction enzyme M protein